MNELFNFDRTFRAGDGQFLGDVIPDEVYSQWFDGSGRIYVLNKGVCGNGGTTGFINYAKREYKGVNIFVPNVSIVKSKEWDGEIDCLYGGVYGVKGASNVRIATWDKHQDVEGCMPDVGMRVDFSSWFGALIVVDEYHKLVDDSSYRDICIDMVRTIISTRKNVVLMSATPNYELVDLLRRASGKEVVSYNVEYDTKVCQGLQFIQRGDKKLYDVVGRIIDGVRSRGERLVVFFNCLQRIGDIVNQMPRTDDVEVLCSKSRENEGVPCYSESYNSEKRIHFLTSAYFTGMDIDEYIDKVVIIGGNDSVTCYTPTEIKQMLGRVRGDGSRKYDMSAVIRDRSFVNKKDYSRLKSDWERDFGYYTNRGATPELMREPAYIEGYLKWLNTGERLKAMDGWAGGFGTFRDMMSVHPEYNVTTSRMDDPGRMKRVRDIPFSAYREARLNGGRPKYRYSAICERYIGYVGMERFENATISDIRRFVKIMDAIGDSDTDRMSRDELYGLLLGDGYYSEKWLTSVMDVLGIPYEKNGLEFRVGDFFNCICLKEVTYDKNRNPKGAEYLLVSLQSFNKTYAVRRKMGTPSIYNMVSPKNYEERISPENKHHISLRVSQPHQRTQAVTTSLESLSDTLQPLTDNADPRIRDFFRVIFSNPQHINGIKNDPEWSVVFGEYKKLQPLMSELYPSAENGRYRHIKANMDLIDTIMVDIDNTIPFSEFKDIYGDLRFTAYPSISNTTEDWTKYRVIFYLENTLHIPGEHMKPLQLLRRSVCNREDDQHVIGSYVNYEQWTQRYENEGDEISYTQDLVDWLRTYTETLATFTGGLDTTTNRADWDLDTCIDFYNRNDRDDHRHRATFIIKLHITPEDEPKFVKWMEDNHPDKLHHYRSHRIR